MFTFACASCHFLTIALNNKQLLDEAEHDIENYPERGQSYLPKPKAEADNIDRGQDDS